MSAKAPNGMVELRVAVREFARGQSARPAIMSERLALYDTMIIIIVQTCVVDAQLRYLTRRRSTLRTCGQDDMTSSYNVRMTKLRV